MPLPPEIYIDYNKDKKPIKDIYSGTAVLMANGPSLQDVPRSFLEQYPTIGTNNIYLYGLTPDEVSRYPEVKPKFYPDFYTILGVDQLGTEEKRDWPRPVIEKAKLAFVNRFFYRYYDAPNVYAIHGIKVSTRHRHYIRHAFSDDITDWVGVGYTNTYIMLQILYYLGFTEVLCVGLDNDYGADPHKRHFYHDDERFSNEPGMGRRVFETGSNMVFGIAKEHYEKDGRKIVNINRNNNTPFEGRIPEW